MVLTCRATVLDGRRCAVIVGVGDDGTLPAPALVELDAAALADLARRLVRARPRAEGGRAGDWRRGVPAGWLADLIADWRAFDPGRLQHRLDQLSHFRVEVGGIDVHLVHLWPG